MKKEKLDIDNKKKFIKNISNPELAQTLKRICEKILFNSTSSPKSILITSSLSGEGSTTISINLAISMAEEGNKKVLLIEGNLKKPAIHDYFDLPKAYGLTDIIFKNVPLDEAVQSSQIPDLYIMGAGADGKNSLPFVEITKLKEFLWQAGGKYDFIVLDAPPVLESPETALISRQFDGTILVIQANKTIRLDAEKAKKEIIEMGGKIIGVILNRKKKYIPQNIYNKYFGHDIWS